MGAIPAIFGMALAAYVLTVLAGQPVLPDPVIQIKVRCAPRPPGRGIARKIVSTYEPTTRARSFVKIVNVTCLSTAEP
eukprot:1189950-Prorocentrum_minimum.AAC.2